MCILRGTDDARRAQRFWSAIVFIILSMTLFACAPANETPTRVAPPANASSARAQNPATRTPAPAATATPTISPTQERSVLPTPPANGISLTLTANPEQTGWVVNDAKKSFTPDNNLNVGMLKGQAYAGIVQFDLTQFAPGTKILFAALELSGRSSSNLGSDGAWTLDVLNTKQSIWTNATYDDVRRAPVLFSLGAPIASTELSAGAKKRFTFSASQLASLEKQLDSSGNLTLRLNGPTTGDNNLFVWDATPGTRQPVLYLVVVPTAFTVITATPTAIDVFAAATQVVAQTLVAQRIGTPTALPRALATATPLPYVVFTAVPTSADRAQAQQTSVYATAVALTTGTPTPFPPNWFTATPLPLAIPASRLTAVPSPTPTLAPPWLPDVAKKSLPAALYNKIAFLTGPRSNPIAWIMDPDGSNLAELTDRSYYDIAAARDVVSPDGGWLLYNAPDTSGRQITQIWRANLKAPNAPPEQITFFTRGVSFAPVWSPGGSKIAFTSTKDGKRGEQEIFLYDFAKPGTWTRLTFTQDAYIWNQYPSWSPDGKQIVYSSDRGHEALFTEIWVMNADGSNAKKLGDGFRDAWAPVWIKWNK